MDHGSLMLVPAAGHGAKARSPPPRLSCDARCRTDGESDAVESGHGISSTTLVYILRTEYSVVHAGTGGLCSMEWSMLLQYWNRRYSSSILGRG